MATKVEQMIDAKESMLRLKHSYNEQNVDGERTNKQHKKPAPSSRSMCYSTRAASHFIHIRSR